PTGGAGEAAAGGDAQARGSEAGGAAGPAAAREVRAARDQGGGDVAPDSLVLEGRFALGPGTVALVTYDADGRALVLRGAERVRPEGGEGSGGDPR
ncbi:MAG TPA: hypothetical protein VMK65_07650, partial [Longimicrobiales bacterium]|nr:hypothetical protein [Longimicrobiales bacterium]